MNKHAHCTYTCNKGWQAQATRESWLLCYGSSCQQEPSQPRARTEDVSSHTHCLPRNKDIGTFRVACVPVTVSGFHSLGMSQLLRRDMF